MTLFLLLASSPACETHDIGRPCNGLLQGPAAQTGGTRLETQEVVEQNVEFPCDDLICVATDGRDGYCSKKCREDAGCPVGFECRQVQIIGDFAHDKFCTWKHCDRPKDCGLRDEFRCCHPQEPSQCGGKAEGLHAVAGEEVKLCTFRE